MSYTETELIDNLAEHMKMCRETARAIAHMRKDARWLTVSQKLDEMRTKLIKLSLMSESGLILP